MIKHHKMEFLVVFISEKEQQIEFFLEWESKLKDFLPPTPLINGLMPKGSPS